jgi:hypothetical protein
MHAISSNLTTEYFFVSIFSFFRGLCWAREGFSAELIKLREMNCLWIKLLSYFWLHTTPSCILLLLLHVYYYSASCILLLYSFMYTTTPSCILLLLHVYYYYSASCILLYYSASCILLLLLHVRCILLPSFKCECNHDQCYILCSVIFNVQSINSINKQQTLYTHYLKDALRFDVESVYISFR